MTLQTILNFARAEAQTDSNGLTDANGIIFANEALVDFHRRLIAAGVDASQLQEAYRDGTVNQGTYLWPTDSLFNKAIELNYGDTTQQSYVRAEQVDISNLPGNVTNSYDWLRVNADPNNPKFDDRGDWFEIFPTPTSAHNVTQLIKIFYYLAPTLYTSTSDTVAYPESLDQATLGFRIASNYLSSLGKADIATYLNSKYEERVKDYIATLSRGSQQPLRATPIQMSGFEF